jgi:hypothetical protein
MTNSTIYLTPAKGCQHSYHKLGESYYREDDKLKQNKVVKKQCIFCAGTIEEKDK